MIFFRKIEKIQAISFDLDDTLYDNYPIMRRAESKLQTYMSHNYPLTQGRDLSFWLAIKRGLLKETPKLAFDMGELRRRTLHTGLSKCGYGSDVLEGYVQSCFDYFYFERSNFTVSESVKAVLETLSDKVPLVAITNGNVNLEQVGIGEYFVSCFHARLHQPMKPHPKMFEMTQDLLKVPHQQILHVGDNLEKDVMGATRVGFKTAWYACDRKMDLNKEATTVLPDIQLHSLTELTALI